MSSWKKIVFPLVAAVVVVAAMGAWQLPQVRASLLGPGLATPSATAQQQPQTGQPFIGISLVNNSAQVKDRLGLSTDQGVVIARVSKDSPGEKAGLKQNDVITAVDGTTVKTAKDVTGSVQAKKVGDQVKLTINRGGTPQDITVTLGSAPEPQAGKGLPFAGGIGGFLGANPMDNLRSGKIELTDKDGKTRTMEIVAGTVQSASSTSFSVMPNGDTTARNFQVTQNTRLGFRGKVEDLKQGDKVVVVAEGGNALQVLGMSPAMRGPNGAPRGPKMMPFHPFGPRTGEPQAPAPSGPSPSSLLRSF